jgi:2-keto-4-pentenoate hydratase/2-oxohepta-3-ene-1,7-dioic acid hydratase in catechol pathway
MKIVRFLYKNKVCKGVLEGDKVSSDGITVHIEDIRVLPPAIPTKIVSVGLNYVDHAKELDMVVPEEPIIFLKPSTSVIGHQDTIMCPSASKRVDYEAELGVVIKKTARYVNAGNAAEYIEGYTCFNDVTARDLQKKDVQWSH